MASKEDRIYRVHLKDALVAAKQGEGELAVLYQEVANDVGAKVRARGDRLTAPELEAAVDEAFQKTAFKRVKIIKTTIEKGGKLGPKASRETMRAVYGDEVAKAQVRGSKKALTEAANRIAGRTTVDGVSVNKRLRKVDRAISSEMAREVEKGIRQKKGILGAARQIEKLDPRRVELPRYLQRVEAAARAGNLDDLKKLTSKYTKYAEGLGEVQADLTRKASKFSLRTATQRFLKDVEKTGAQGIDKIVDRYVKDKAAFRANLIARHETVEAFRRSYIEQSKNKPGVLGMAWRLSPTRHPVPDECDIYANQNAHKLGPGVYPADKVPKHPHPACICSVTVVLDKHHFQRGDAANDNAVPPLLQDTKSPDALGWLSANEQIAAKILGPTRHQLMKQGVKVLGHDGKPLLVRDLLGAQRQKMAVGALPMPRTLPDVPSAPGSGRGPPRQATRRRSRAARSIAPTSDELQYGAPAPRIADASARYDQEVEWVSRLGVNDLPGLHRMSGEAARDIEATFGLKQTRPVRSVVSLPAEFKGVDGRMRYDGQMQIRVHGPRAAPYRVLVHETMHTMGGAKLDAYRGIGVVLEECATEELTDAYCGGTWKLAKRGAQLDLADPDKAYAAWLNRPHEWRANGIYQEGRGRLMSIVSGATKELSPEALSRKLRGAMVKWKSAAYDTPQDALKAFIDALEPTPAQRRFYERAIVGARWKEL